MTPPQSAGQNGSDEFKLYAQSSIIFMALPGEAIELDFVWEVRIVLCPRLDAMPQQIHQGLCA